MDRIARAVRALLIALATVLAAGPGAGVRAEPAAAAARAPADAAASGLPPLTILCWHDVRDGLVAGFAADPDVTAIDVDDLVAQFELIRALGYTPISLQQWLDAREGRATLPPRPVLLSFDDGHRSLYTRVFPLLKLYGYPAVAAIIGGWMPERDDDTGTDRARASRESSPQAAAPRGDAPPARPVVRWSELREMADSGLLEVASHSHALHAGHRANPQGNRQPATGTRRFDTAGYEDDAAFRRRVASDLDAAANLIARHLGKRPRTMVWPYGAYNDLAIAAALEAGYEVTMNLDVGVNRADTPPQRLRRILVQATDGLADFARLLDGADTSQARAIGTQRAIGVRLDDVYDADPQRQERRLSALVARVRRLGVNVVHLEAFSDPDRDGIADALYFPNAQLPMRADLFNRVAWQLRTRAEVKVFGVMPVAAYAGVPRAQVGRLFEDMARHAPMAGIVFRDDARHTGDRDLPEDADGDLAFTLAHAQLLKAALPELIVAREIAAQEVRGHPELAGASRLDAWLARYDLLIVGTVPASGDTMLPAQRLRDLVDAVARRRGALDRTVFLHDDGGLAGDALAAGRRSEALLEGIALLRDAGARHLGYTHDDFVHDTPPLARMRPLVSTSTQFNRRN
jgi:biofilm PGA synthesis lipoprotein PgaB